MAVARGGGSSKKPPVRPTRRSGGTKNPYMAPLKRVSRVVGLAQSPRMFVQSLNTANQRGSGSHGTRQATWYPAPYNKNVTSWLSTAQRTMLASDESTGRGFTGPQYAKTQRARAVAGRAPGSSFYLQRFRQLNRKIGQTPGYSRPTG